MRLSIESDFTNGPRNKRLARTLSLHRLHTAGCCLEVWAACYTARTPFVSCEDADIASEVDGFADALVKAELADRAKVGDVATITWESGGESKSIDVLAQTDGIRLRGVCDRIAFLFKQSDRSKRGVAARRDRRAGLPTGQPVGQPVGSSTGNPPVDPLTSSSTSDLTSTRSEICPRSDDPGPSVGSKSGAVDHEREPKPDRAARVPDRAWAAADALRNLVLEEDPKAAIGRKPWGPDVKNGTRFEWADALRLVVERDKRTYEELWETMRWVFKQQTDAHRFVVQSPDALRQKWDRIQAVRRTRAGPRGKSALIGSASPRTDHPESDTLIPCSDL